MNGTTGAGSTQIFGRSVPPEAADLGGFCRHLQPFHTSVQLPRPGRASGLVTNLRQRRRIQLRRFDTIILIFDGNYLNYKN